MYRSDAIHPSMSNVLKQNRIFFILFIVIYNYFFVIFLKQNKIIFYFVHNRFLKFTKIKMGVISSSMRETMKESFQKQQEFMLETQKMQVRFFYFLLSE